MGTSEAIIYETLKAPAGCDLPDGQAMGRLHHKNARSLREH